MEAMREAWTDERLDDLNRKVEQGFARIDADLRSHRVEMNERFEGLEGRIASLTRTLVLMNGTIVAALVGLIATQI